MTKLHEEYIRGNVEEILSICSTLKGEMVLVIEGNSKKEEVDLNLAISRIEECIESGMKTKEAIVFVSKEMNMKKNELYDLYHKK